MSDRIVCVIPARLGSTRFPGKMLARLGNKPLVQWAFEAAKGCDLFDQIVIATDSAEIALAAQGFGATALFTDRQCQSGTDRLIELQEDQKLEGEIWVNWQGDEPFICKEVIQSLLQSIADEHQLIWTLKKKIDQEEEVQSPHVVKVVTDHRGQALYFSRSPIPSTGPVFKHVGLYAFRDRVLKEIGDLPISPIEESERLEQLRFLYYGLPIQVHEIQKEIFGIDTKEQLARAEEMCYTRR